MGACLLASKATKDSAMRDGNADGRLRLNPSAGLFSVLTTLACPSSETSETVERETLSELTSLPPECPARMSASPGSGLGWPAATQDSFMSLRASCKNFD